MPLTFDRGATPPRLLELVEGWLSRRWVPVAVNVAVLALLSASLAQGALHLMAAPGPQAEPTRAAAVDDYDLEALLAADLFGRPEPDAAQDPPVETIPLSQLTLSLTGLMVTPAGSFALVSANGGAELPFGVGHEIIDGVALHAIHADRVLIRHGGRIEALVLKDDALPLPQDAVVVPDLRRDGGFVVAKVPVGTLYDKLGLIEGDVVRSVGGRPVNTPGELWDIYQLIHAESNVNIEVQRDGRTEVIVYNMR